MKKYSASMVSKTEDSCVLDMKDLTWSNTHLIFLTRVFKNGYLLGFWSHSPWGRMRDQEQGWMVIDYSTLEIIDECVTKTMGIHAGEAREWLASLKDKYGKSQFLLNEYGERQWKMTEV